VFAFLLGKDSVNIDCFDNRSKSKSRKSDSRLCL